MIHHLSPARLYLLMRGINSFAMALVLTFELAYHTVIVGLNPFQLVLVGVVLESMTFLFEIPTGMIADLYSRRLSVIIGIFLIGSGFLIEGLIPTFATVLLAQVLWGLGFTFFSGAETAWVTDELGIDKAHTILLQATQIGQALALVGTLLGAALSTVSIALPILVGAVLFLLVGVGLVFTMPEAGFRPSARGQQQFGALIQPFRTSASFVRTHPLLWMILLLGLIIGLCVGGFDRLYTPHMLQDVTLPTLGRFGPVFWLGMLNGIITLGSLIGTELIRRNLQTNKQLVLIRLLMLLYTGMIVGSLFFALAGEALLAVIGFCLSQTLRNIGRPLLLLWVNQNAEPQIRATVISSYWQANAFGQIVGSPLLGWLGTVASLRIALALGTMLYTATLPLLALAQRRRQQMERESVSRS